METIAYPDIIIDNIRLYTFAKNNYNDRPTIVFLHESLGCVALWKDFPEKLGEICKCNILVYDRQGYGKSAPFTSTKRDNNYLEKEAGILNLLLNKLNITQAILYGHSDGGSIALIAAAKHQKNIKGVITEGAHVFVEQITIKGILVAVEKYETTNLKEKLEKYHGDNTENVFRIWSNTWLSESFQNWNIEHFLPEIQCPTLVIQGETDEYGSMRQVDSIVNGIAQNAQKLIIPNNGHSPHITAKDYVLEEVSIFIKSFI